MNGFYSSVAGATLRWHDFPGDGLPVVFIHGLGCASSYDYPRIASDPALRERRKILIDLPGFGYSDKPRAFSYNIHEQALVLEQFLSHLRLQRFALFGHSMGGSIAIEAAGLLGERVTTLLVSEPNLFAGGGEYSRRIAAQSETAFVADGYARLLAEERSPWAGCLQNSAPWAVWRAASSLIRGSDTPWFTQLCQLRCQKMLIVGERSRSASCPMPDTRWRGKIRRGWRSLSPAIVKRRWASEGKLAGLGLDRYPAQLGEFRDPGPAAKAAIAGGFAAAKWHLRLIMHRWAIDMANPGMQTLRYVPRSGAVAAVDRSGKTILAVVGHRQRLLFAMNANNRFHRTEGLFTPQPHLAGHAVQQGRAHMGIVGSTTGQQASAFR